MGGLTSYMGNPEIHVGKMVQAIPFGELQKTWAMIWGMKFFHSF